MQPAKNRPLSRDLPLLKFPGVCVAAGLTILALGFGACGPDAGGFPERKVVEPSPELLQKGTVIRGRAVFSGDAPRRATIDMAADAYCKAKSGGTTTESVVLGENSGLRDVLIHITAGLETYTFDWERAQIVLDQKDCVYVPHVLAVRTRQPVVFLNSDQTSHNVNTKASPQGFNATTASQGSKKEHSFAEPELSILAKCDIHPWMNAIIHVLDHPYFSISGGDGTWELPRPLPPGTYTVEALHPTLGRSSQTVTVTEGQTVPAIEFTFAK